MGRIRTIKPEFSKSESNGRLSREARLLFILLWTVVDDEGRARAAPKLLAGELYPFDDDARDLIEAWLNELDTSGKIRRYEVDGTHYLDIPKFLEHQLINRPSKSRLPEFTESSLNNQGSLNTRARDTRSKILDTRSMVTEPRARKFLWVKNGFEELFWTKYPHKVGKADAKKVFDRIGKSDTVSLNDILDGVDQYIREKPPDRQWCNPATWLRQERWLDEPGTVSKPKGNGQKSMATIAQEIADASDERRNPGTGDGALLNLSVEKH